MSGEFPANIGPNKYDSIYVEADDSDAPSHIPNKMPAVRQASSSATAVPSPPLEINPKGFCDSASFSTLLKSKPANSRSSPTIGYLLVKCLYHPARAVRSWSLKSSTGFTERLQQMSGKEVTEPHRAPEIFKNLIRRDQQKVDLERNFGEKASHMKASQPHFLLLCLHFLSLILWNIASNSSQLCTFGGSSSSFQTSKKHSFLRACLVEK